MNPGIPSAEILEITLRSLLYAGTATALAMVVGLPIGLILGRRKGWMSNGLGAVFGALTAMPTVIIGLFAFLLLSRTGLLGGLRWLYASPGVIFAEFFLGFPIVVTHLRSGLRRTDEALYETLYVLGTPRPRAFLLQLREFTPVIAGAFVLSFGRILGEVGIVMMIGGNIRHVTRTMTTAIALESGKGALHEAIMLGGILMVLALVINLLVAVTQKHE